MPQDYDSQKAVYENLKRVLEVTLPRIPRNLKPIIIDAMNFAYAAAYCEATLERGALPVPAEKYRNGFEEIRRLLG